MTQLNASIPTRLHLRAVDQADTATSTAVHIEGLAVPWNTTVRMNYWGDTVEFAPGSLNVPDPARVKFAADHRTHALPLVFGYGTEFTDDGDGLHATFEVPREELADPEVARVVRQMGNGVRDALSIGVDILEADEERENERDPFAPIHYRVTSGRLLETSSVILPMFDDARHTRVAASRYVDPAGWPRFRLTAASDPVEPEEPEDPEEPEGEEEVSDTAVADRVAAHAQVVATVTPPAPIVPHPLSRFRSFGEYALARYHDPRVPDLAAALADQVPANSPGVMPPSWLGEVRGIVDFGRPFITGLGGAISAGETGMKLDWPYFDGDLYALVAAQSAPKAEVTSVRVDIKDGTATLLSYAGGSDIALQVIERSSPSYLDTYLRIMSAAYAAVTDKAAVTAAFAVAGGTVVCNVATADAAAIATAIFAASSKVSKATGRPASLVACASDVFPGIAGKIASLMAPAANTAGGSMDAGTLAVSLAGLPVTEVPGAAAGTVLVTNSLAVRWAEDGPRTIDALEVAKLGRDVAIYGFGVTTPFIPAGIVKFSATAE